MENSAFLGRGWSFPPAFGARGASVSMADGERDIAESLMILFSTRPKERLLHHEFGCDFESYIFEDIDAHLLTNLQKMVTDAVERYEPRIELARVEFVGNDPLNGKLHMELEFTIKATNARHNLVFPFMLEEGSLYQEIIRS